MSRFLLGIVIGVASGAIATGNAAFNRMPIADSTVTVSSCGTGSPSVAGNSVRGRISLGGGNPTACTLNFSPALPVAPTCLATAGNANASVRTSAISTSAATFTLSATNTTMYYVCIL